jgi:hypothetical protein
MYSKTTARTDIGGLEKMMDDYSIGRRKRHSITNSRNV